MKNLIGALYYLKDSKADAMEIDEYRSVIKHLLKGRTMTKFGHVVSFVEDALSNGIETFSETWSYYVDVSAGKFYPAFNIGDGIFNLFKVKYTLPKMDRSKFDKDQMEMVLRWFRFIPKQVEEPSEAFLDNIFTESSLYVDLKESKRTESKFKSDSDEANKVLSKIKTLTEALKESLSVKAGVEVVLGKTYTNKYGNDLREVFIFFKGKRGEGKFRVFVPMSIDGIYSLGTSQFIQVKAADEFLNGTYVEPLKRVLSSVMKNVFYFNKAYALSKDNHEFMERSFQAAINRVLYQRNFSAATVKELLQVMSKQDAQKAAKEDSYHMNNFIMIASGVGTNNYDSLTPFEIWLEHHKLYFKEFVGRSDGALIHKRWGKKGYEAFRNLPLNNKFISKCDPGYLNNTGNFIVMYTNNKKTSIMQINPFAFYNYQSFRNASSAFIVGHAYELDGNKPDKELTVYSKDFRYIPPGYGMWFLLKDHIDSSGVSTFDGQRLINKQTKLNIHEVDKIAFHGADKGVSRFMQDDIYFMHNNKKMPLHVTSPLNIASRKNFGVLLEGLYNGKKLLSGNTKQELRDFSSKPLANKELLGAQEVFVNGKSIGKYFVGYMQAFFVKEMESTFKDVELDENDEIQERESSIKKYILGSEWIERLILLGLKRFKEELIGNKDKIESKIEKLEETTHANTMIYGKRGKIVKGVLQKKTYGFSSTITANAYVPQGTARFRLLKPEFIEFMVMIKMVEPEFDVDSALDNFNNDRPVKLPPSLQVGHPSIDDANTIYVDVTIEKAPERTKHGFVEVNPLVWSRQGRDFDGDQGIYNFFSYRHRNVLKEAFGYNNHEYTPTFEYAIVQKVFPELKVFNISKFNEACHKVYEGLDLKSFIEVITDLKKGKDAIKENIKTFFNQNTPRVQTLNEIIVGASANLITTRISKMLIGVAKGTTMRILFYLVDAIEELGIDDPKLNKYVIDTINALNWMIVQPVIDIQKHSDNLLQVIKTVMFCYRFADFVSFKIQAEYYPTARAFRQMKDYLSSQKAIVYHKSIDGGWSFYAKRENFDAANLKGYLGWVYRNTKADELLFDLEGNYERFNVSNIFGWSNDTDIKELTRSIHPDSKEIAIIKQGIDLELKDFDINKFYTFK